ncbi:MAG TPA: hypothetical protein DCZ93_10835 [Elusimicrobia bacterium]|nr:hypothetical protein [Elusimicrobiota bacterium]
MKDRHGVELSRRSVAQYRKDMSLAAGGSRPSDAVTND